MNPRWAPLAGALAAAVVVGLVARDSTPPRVTGVGPADTVRSEWVDGEPLWIINDGETVRVFDAVNPHPWWGLSELVGWCESADAFTAWWDGSRFDMQGRWLFGPAPRDLDQYEVLAQRDGAAQLGGVAPAQGRSGVGDQPPRAWCAADGMPGPPARFHRVDGSQRQLFEGAVVAGGGYAHFCPVAQGASCTGGPRVPEFRPDAPDLVVSGRFLARQRNDELYDVIYLPAEHPAAPAPTSSDPAPVRAP